MLSALITRRGLKLSILTVLIPIFLQLVYINYVSYNVVEGVFGDFILHISFIALVSSFLFSIPIAALTRYINHTSNKERFVSEFLTMQIPLNLLGILIIYLYGFYYANLTVKVFLVLSVYFVLLNQYSLNKTLVFQLVQRKKYLNFSVLEKLARFFFPVLAYHFFHSEDGLLYGLLLGYLILTIVSSNQTSYFKRKMFFSYKKFRIYFLYAYPLLLINIASWVISLSDRYFIDNYSGSGEVGVYSILAQVAGFSSILASIFTIYVQPLVFKAFSQGKVHALEEYFAYLKKVTLVFFLGYIAFLVSPVELFSILIKPEILSESRYYNLLHVLIISSILGSYVTMLTNVFYLTNKLHFLALFWLLSAVVNLVGNTFIDMYGIGVAALSKSVSYAIMLLLMLYWGRKFIAQVKENTR